MFCYLIFLSHLLVKVVILPLREWETLLGLNMKVDSRLVQGDVMKRLVQANYDWELSQNYSAKCQLCKGNPEFFSPANQSPVKTTKLKAIIGP